MTNQIEKLEFISSDSVDVSALFTDNYVVVCDTNVYLGLYRFSPDYANFALECLKEIQAYLMLPYTVKVEYHKHYHSQLSFCSQCM